MMYTVDDVALTDCRVYEYLGIGWSSSLLAFIALACAPFPVLFMRYGKRIRAASKFAGKK